MFVEEIFNYNIVMVLSSRIKELRIEKGVNRETLAKAVGVDKRTISFWENGINEPKAGYLIKLAKFFEVSADYLLGLED